MEELLKMILDEFETITLRSGGYLTVALGGLFVLWKGLNYLTKHDDDTEIETRGNQALGLVRSAQVMAYFLGLTGSFFSPKPGNYWVHLAIFCADAFLVLSLILLSVKLGIADKYLLRRRKGATAEEADNAAKLLAGNMGVAQAERGNYFGMGFLLLAAFVGADASPWIGFVNAVVFWALSQAVYALGYIGVDKILPVDYEAEIGRGVEAAGREVGGYLASLGIMMASIVVGSSDGIISDIVAFAVAVVPMLLWPLVIMGVVDFALLRQTSLTASKHHGNMATANMVAAIMVGTALVLFGAVVSPSVTIGA